MNVFELFARLSLDTSEYERDLDDAGKRAEKTKETLIAGAKLAGKAIAGVATGISSLRNRACHSMRNMSSSSAARS